MLRTSEPTASTAPTTTAAEAPSYPNTDSPYGAISVSQKLAEQPVEIQATARLLIIEINAQIEEMRASGQTRCGTVCLSITSSLISWRA